ncbi:Acid sphingomyelinase-like phosphodiesterase 3a [Heterocephalus glaber]|uniref:Acid sphingomyelinase-like phosphodiesterase 3a n=1 Tax=Heterocephalus glaber TaxID=10181 RepID=G5B3W3_HETGA|nr:Acid sphingomyelinase-like phosphodiesterase 3a [Heterocephalus glaber]
MIWTGDSPPHVPVPELSTDAVVKDQLPIATSQVYDAVANLWKAWLDEEALSTLRKAGFYSQKVPGNPNLRIVSLNTNLYYGPNAVTLNQTDPAHQFEWLENTLTSSQQNKEKVDPIDQFYGHMHRDSLMVLSDGEGRPVSSLFVSPAVTPVRNVLEKETNNPGVRLFQYNPGDYTLLDMLQYYLNLTEANLKGESNWKLEYSLTQTYGVGDLRPQSLYGLAKQFATPDSKQFVKYYNYFFVSYDSSVVCDEKCKALQICAIMNLDRASYSGCLQQHLGERRP